MKMSFEDQITLFSTGFYVCLGIMIIGLGLTILFFFKFRIPQVFALITGRFQKKTVENMRKSGILRNAEEIEMERSDSAKLSYMNMTSRTGDFVTQAFDDSTASDLKQTVEGATDTTVLENVQDTAILQETIATTVLAGNAPVSAGGHAVFNGEAVQSRKPAQQRDPALEGYGTTMILNTVEQQYSFEITERTIIMHTNEMI